MAVSISWGLVLGSLQQGSYHVGSMLGAPDFWRLPSEMQSTLKIVEPSSGWAQGSTLGLHYGPH